MKRMKREICILVTLVIAIILYFIFFAIHSIRNEQVYELARSYWQWNAKMDNMSAEPLVSNTFSDVLASYGIVSSPNPWQANIVFFNDVTYATSYMATMRAKWKERIERRYITSHTHTHIMGINGSDLLASKERLPGIMRGRYVPKTFILRDVESMRELRRVAEPDKLYIVKKDVQQQKGLRIIWGEVSEISRALTDEFLICQDLLQDPFCIGTEGASGRKVNLRVYMLLSFSNKGMRMWIFDDGFMYYTPQLFIRGSSQTERNITTGYIDRSVYDECPLTLRDLSKHMGPEEYGRLWGNVVQLFRYLKGVYKPILVGMNAPLPRTTHTMYFGCDIAPDSNLDVLLMEVNKGPDLDYKDERDAAVKKKMVGALAELLFNVGTTFERQKTCQRSFIEI
jgi:Tubulin-tyrosine ligase family